MSTGIFGALDNENVAPSLLQGLQRLEIEYGNYNGAGIATLKKGRIRHLQLSGKLHNLPDILQQQPINGRFGIAYIHQTPPHEIDKYHTFLCATENLAVAHHGFVNNIKEIRTELLKRGCEFSGMNECEVILHLLNRYLIAGISPVDAVTMALARLQGYFAFLTLFTYPQELLIAARRGCVLAIGVNKNMLYVSSDTHALSMLSHQIVQLEEGNPAVLHSVKTVLDTWVTI